MMIPAITWTFPGRLVRVIDADTLDVQLDCGLHMHRTERLRLLGVNAPEMKGPSRGEGLIAQSYVHDWLDDAGSESWPLVIQTVKADVFGRFLASVWRQSDGASLNDALLAAGMAVVFEVKR